MIHMNNYHTDVHQRISFPPTGMGVDGGHCPLAFNLHTPNNFIKIYTRPFYRRTLLLRFYDHVCHDEHGHACKPRGARVNEQLTFFWFATI
jgi:hypothetical protein